MENISAISTPRGTGGVAIIRISGDSPLEVAGKMFSPSSKKTTDAFVPGMMYPGYILLDGFEDYGLCVYFKAPKSFTGEDVVEFHCHGGEAISQAVLEKTFSLGCRSAEGGEFTKRAFLNGKLSLSSCEGMIDMINADSKASLRAASQLYRSETVEKIKRSQDKLKFILASIAADTDYPEEDVLDGEDVSLKDKLSEILCDVKTLSGTYPRGRCVKNGVSVALCGKPNVGKSSLLNALLGYGKAIVSSEEGTTRDAVEGEIEIDGIAFHLTDTAGLREKAGEVETKGIEIAKNVISCADIVVYVSDEDLKGCPDVDKDKLLTVFNKADILKAPEGFDCVISALTGEGLDELKSSIAGKVPPVRTADGAVICEERHFNALKRAESALMRAVNNLQSFPADAVSLDIDEAWSALGEITGETANENIIEEVFSKFCVGK